MIRHTVTDYQLVSGARGLVVDVPGSSVINLEVRFNSGYSFGNRDQYEIPHVLEHVLASVTRRYCRPNQFMIEASKNGAYVNASTSVRANGYVYEFAPFELERMLDLIEEQIVRPLISEDRLQSEIGNVREELTRNTTQPGSVNALAFLAKTQPGQWMDYLDRIEQLPRLTLEEAVTHYRTRYTASNAFFSVAGEIGEGKAIVARLERIFAQLETGVRLTWRAERARGLAKPVVRHMPIGQLYYRVSRSLPELSLRQRRAMALLRTVLVGGMASRIYGEAREHGWAYSVGGIFSGEPGAANAGFAGYVTAGHVHDLFGLMNRELAAVASRGVTADELAAARRLMTGNWLRAMQTPADVLAWYSEEFDEWGVVRGFAAELEALDAITAGDVTAAAALIFQQGRFAMAITGDVTPNQAAEYQRALGEFGAAGMTGARH